MRSGEDVLLFKQMNRLHPFEHAFAELAEQHFAALEAELRETELSAADPVTFSQLPRVSTILSEMSGSVTGDHPEIAEAYLTLLWAAYQFWKTGKDTRSIEAESLDRTLASAATITLTSLPTTACYLMFPQHRVWAQIAEEQPHEPLDGIFYVPSGDGQLITLLAVLGLRADRPGFSQISVTSPGSEVLRTHPDALARGFAPTMTGGDQAAFRSVTSEVELVELVRLVLGSLCE